MVLPDLEYCSVVWCSVTDTHRTPLDHVINVESFLAGGLLEGNFFH